MSEAECWMESASREQGRYCTSLRETENMEYELRGDTDLGIHVDWHSCE